MKIKQIVRFLATCATVLWQSSKCKSQRAKYKHRSFTQMLGDATVTIAPQVCLSTQIYYSKTIRAEEEQQQQQHRRHFSKLQFNSKGSSFSLEHQEIWYPGRHHLSEKAAATQCYTENFKMRKNLFREKEKEKYLYEMDLFFL